MIKADARDPIAEFLSDPEIAPFITSVRRVPASDAVYSGFPPGLDPRLKAALSGRGVGSLYSHQRAAWDMAAAGRDFVVVTPTASGKTLCYNLPVVQALLDDADARALYLFPTKALSQDQQAELNALVDAGALPIKAATYDGDTPQSTRKAARDAGRIIISNPDMLHSGVLPNHAKWIKFFAGLKYIVVDEMHAYRGVFGSHVSNVFRRLLRVAAYYGASPRFILCSATIGNPSELAEALIGRPVSAITENGAPRAEKIVAFYNPPVVDAVQGIRRSSADESMAIAAKLLASGTRTILFARSRLRVEILASYLNSRFENVYTDNSRIRVEPYRSGLLPGERRQIERGLREGAVHGVVSTNALELGIDIGGLDAAVIAGWPGSLASFWQQAGRAGRRRGASMAVYVASSAPVDQYLIEHPDRFFGASAEKARIDPDNPYIYADHVKCAAFELPFRDGEVFGPDPEAVLSFLEEEGTVRNTGGRWYWSDSGYPAEKISLRSATADNVVIIDTTAGRNEVIGEMDRPSAKELVFDDAIYIHRGRQFIVLKLDIDNRQCLVEERETNYYTDAVVKNDIKVLTEDERTGAAGLPVVIGDLLVRSSAEKFKKLRFHSNENIGYGEIYLPPEEMQTRSLAMLFPEEGEPGRLLAGMGELERAAALAAFCGTVRSFAPVSLLCDRSDIGSAWRVRDDHFGVPAIYVWDRYPGGTGLSEALAPSLRMVLKAAAERVASCDCEDGCPSCIGLAGESFSAVRHRKNGAARLLQATLAALGDSLVAAREPR
ncbi:MAG: ATP-dependent helicase [Spirochaetae bacterium HGW-Spirochaetae-3]|jgi:DEAD/DEAH box helicase domain-containing protein|nr:MAG: ATP-dependent helicase [Spirochaetae bacterium HGW-Spirochaetae-3]